MPSVYNAAALYLELVLQSIRARGRRVDDPDNRVSAYCLTRAAMEAGSQALCLLEPVHTEAPRGIARSRASHG